MKIFYHSDDGKVFESKEDCLAYENRHEKFKFLVTWYPDESEAFCYPEGLPKNLSPSFITDPKKIVDSLHYNGIIYIPDKETLEVVRQEAETDDSIINTDNMEVGFNFWNCTEYGWVSPDYYRSQLLQMIRSIDNFLEKAHEDITTFNTPAHYDE